MRGLVGISKGTFGNGLATSQSPTLALLLALPSLAVGLAVKPTTPVVAYAPERVVAASLTLAEPAEPAALDCISCHHFERSLSHPVGVTPKMPIPAAFPLENGRISCITCHDTAKLALHDRHSPTGEAYLRRLPGDEGLCAACHHSANNSGGASADPHAVPQIRVHPVINSRGRATELDEESQSCMACHDGTVAADSGSHLPRSATLNPERDHPIGVKYQSRHATGGNEEIQLVSPAALDKRVRLFDQRVGCGSCHSVYSGQKDLLVMSNFASRLCLSCHVE